MKKSNTIAMLATYQPRFTKIVWDAVMSLAPQVDCIYITINYPYTESEKYIFEKSAMGVEEQTRTPVILKWLKEDIGDLAKFWPLVNVNFREDKTILICDDDLIYPGDYVARITEWIDGGEKETNHPYLSFGGKKLKSELPYNTWKASWQKRISVFKGIELAEEIDIPLTGVTAFKRGSMARKLNYDLRFRNNGDLLMAKWARQSGATLICPAFAEGWLKYNSRMGNKQTIWDDMNASPEIQERTADLATEVMQTPIIESTP